MNQIIRHKKRPELTGLFSCLGRGVKYCFQSFRLVFSSFQRLGQKPRFLSQLVYLLELHDIQHREQDAVYLGIPTLVEVTVIPMGHWMSG